MDRRNDTYISAIDAAVAVMSHESHLLGTAVLPEAFGLEVQGSPHQRRCSLSISPSVLTDLQRDGYIQSDLLLDVDELDRSDGRYYPTDWKLKDSEAIFGTSIKNFRNGMAALNGQILYKHQADRYDAAVRSSEAGKARTKALKTRADTTRRSINSDSNSSQFDPLDVEDVPLTRHKDTLEKISPEPILCSVCGDTVAGFHCGAYVCEACKKFFVRCLKQDTGMKFTCAHNQCCEITKETRTQCPYCRFQKCLKLGMYKPGGPNVSSEIGHIPCKVCGAPSSGFHFGAITCEGCKGFFRRTVKERDSLKYQCSRNSSCVITWKTRNICKMCRYHQCLKAGMKPDKSRIGRQPNSVKHATMIELNQIKTAKGLAPLPFPAREFKPEPLDLIDCGSNTDPTTAPNSNGYGIAQTPPASCCENTFHLVPSTDVAVNSDDVIMEQGSVADTARRVTSDIPQKDHRDRMPGGAYTYEHNEVGPYRSPGRKLSASAPSSTDPCAGKPQFQHTTTSTQFDRAVNSASSSLKPVALPPEETEAFCEKLPPVDFSPVEVTCSDIPPCFPSVKPTSLPDQALSLPDYDTVISIIHHSYKDLSVILTRSEMEEVVADSTMLNIWDSMMTQFAHCAQATLRFAKKVPGFRKFAISEQIHMVQSSMFPIVVVVLSLIYDEVNRRFCYFMYSHDEMCHILRKFEPFQLLVPVLHHMGRKVRQLDLDEIEVAFLCALHLMDSGNKHIYKELLLDSLEEYIKKKFGQPSDRNGQILLCLRDMVSTNHIHQQAVNALMCPGSKYSHLEIPQLFKESFIGMDD